jgi:NADH:ubiquinone oxidoreductase subunit F (NADH-binding)/(2Fe-2S) ferredoxin/NAD-dependent dihydropyrimidine dehydrogenase PreA subunit
VQNEAGMSQEKRRVFVCLGSGCVSSGSQAVYAALQKEAQTHGMAGYVDIKRSGCHGFCQQGPLVSIEPDGIVYTRVRPEDAGDIVSKHLRNGQPVERPYYHDPLTGAGTPLKSDMPFYAQQTRLILRNCSKIDPESIEDYLEVGGYQALRLALSVMTRDEIIEEITRSRLRGRGGAGFPTGRKWAACRRAPGEPKYVICNGDEGDPGAFMDRSILEADPHSVIEGIIIGAYAIGASHGYIFVRAEYPLAVERLRKAVDQALKKGFLGDNILDSGFTFHIEITCGSGAFVSGEATALIATIEGWTGEPRPRPPRTAETGLWGQPTTINNVKTWATVPLIISRGADWFSSIGTDRSKGTMVFSLTGSVRNTGLVEVPMGTTLRRIVFDIGGGIPDDRGLKAIQIGGPSGGCVPASLLDIPVDYEEMMEIGATVGAGGLVVLDETICMVQIAKYFLAFTMEESCGKCVPCREGIRRMHDILADITEGRGRTGDLELLQEMGETIADSSLCGLGGSAPGPVLTTLRYFAEEYRAHVEEGRCPALSCRALLRYEIDPVKCQGCAACAPECPEDAIAGSPHQPHSIDQDKCSKCGACIDACPTEYGAVIKQSRGRSPVTSCADAGLAPGLQQAPTR